MKTRPDCNGEGVIEKGTDDEQQCPTCGGSGFVPNDDDDHEEEYALQVGFPANRLASTSPAGQTGWREEFFELPYVRLLDKRRKADIAGSLVMLQRVPLH